MKLKYLYVVETLQKNAKIVHFQEDILYVFNRSLYIYLGKEFELISSYSSASMRKEKSLKVKLRIENLAFFQTSSRVHLETSFSCTS